MLENWRYNRAREARSNFPVTELNQIFLDHEYKTQLALDKLGIEGSASPSEVPKAGCILAQPDLMFGLRIPYVVEVLGMPCAGKSTMIRRYLEEAWAKDRREKIAFVDEGVKEIKEEYGDLRYSDPLGYSLLGGLATFINQIQALREVRRGMQFVITDRGQIDRRVFRRTFFGQGKVEPRQIADEEKFIHYLENTPLQIGAIIMMMTRSEESVKREENPGPVTNMDFLPSLADQYWRLHWEISKGELPCRLYTCIDAEKDENEVYERFKYTMDLALNIHGILSAAFAKAFPDEFDRARIEFASGQKRKDLAEEILGDLLGGRVLIVGGDEMITKEDILQKKWMEVLDLRRGAPPA